MKSAEARKHKMLENDNKLLYQKLTEKVNEQNKEEKEQLNRVKEFDKIRKERDSLLEEKEKERLEKEKHYLREERKREKKKSEDEASMKALLEAFKDVQKTKQKIAWLLE